MNAKMDASKLLKNLDRLEKNLNNNVQTAIINIAQKVVDTAKNIVPVRTGELRDSITYEVKEEGVEIRAGADHASYVEYGTLRMQAQQFFFPSVNAHKQALIKEIDKELMRGIK